MSKQPLSSITANNLTVNVGGNTDLKGSLIASGNYDENNNFIDNNNINDNFLKNINQSFGWFATD